MKAVAHRRFVDVFRDWLRHLFHHSPVARDSADEFERFFGS
ncbi:MAG: hypothetical protein QOK28_3714 [Actinomycetota bacterium]|jgi:hypothetical protein